MSDDPEIEAVAREWLVRADGDLRAARMLYAGGGPTWTVCFHAQQAVEKHVKALLVLRGTRFAKTHDIGELLELLPAPERPPLDPEAAFELTRSASTMRYPETPEPSQDEAERLLEHASRVRTFVVSILPPGMIEP